MPDGPAEEDAPLAGAGRRGRRAGILIVIGVAVLFIGSSAGQVVPAVFGFGVRPLPVGPPGSSQRACAEGVRALSAVRSASADRTEPSSPSAWDRESPVYQACAASPEGLDAWAALLRLRMTEQQLPYAGPTQLDPLRRDLYAHLPADLR